MTATEFIIKAVKGLDMAEANAWWAEISVDRYAISGMGSWPETMRTLGGWLAAAHEPGVDMNVVYSEAGERLAFFWVSGQTGHMGFLHFNILAAGQPQAVEIGRRVLKILWLCGYKCLAGLTPRHLRNAVAYARAVGGKTICEWPGACYWSDKKCWEDGVLSQFLPGCEEL
jgi:hypothetical protein